MFLSAEDLAISDAETLSSYDESDWDDEYDSDFICDEEEESDYEPEDWEVKTVVLNPTIIINAGSSD